MLTQHIQLSLITKGAERFALPAVCLNYGWLIEYLIW